MILDTQRLLEKSASIFLQGFVDNLLYLALQHLVSKNKRLRYTSASAVASFAQALLHTNSSVLEVKEKASTLVGHFLEKNSSRRNPIGLDCLFVFAYTGGDGQLQPATLSDSVLRVCTIASLITNYRASAFLPVFVSEAVVKCIGTGKGNISGAQYPPQEVFSKGQRRIYGSFREGIRSYEKLLDATWRSLVWTYTQLSPSTTPSVSP